jgi:hypothetical protein
MRESARVPRDPGKIHWMQPYTMPCTLCNHPRALLFARVLSWLICSAVMYNKVCHAGLAKDFYVLDNTPSKKREGLSSQTPQRKSTGPKLTQRIPRMPHSISSSLNFKRMSFVVPGDAVDPIEQQGSLESGVPQEAARKTWKLMQVRPGVCSVVRSDCVYHVSTPGTC